MQPAATERMKMQSIRCPISDFFMIAPVFRDVYFGRLLFNSSLLEHLFLVGTGYTVALSVRAVLGLCTSPAYVNYFVTPQGSADL